jgi:hypothetical protein
VVLEEMFLTFQHLPFQQQRCAECHAAQNSLTPADTDPSAEQKDKRAISWLRESAMAGTQHGFVLAGENIGSSLVIQVQGGGGVSFRQEIAVPPLKTLAEVKDSGLPPVVSAARVLKIERGLFLSATIGWQTDTLTDALVSYGTKDLSQTSQPSQRLGHRHEVILYDLKPDKTYHASIISRDLFGRRQTSEALTFSTAKALTAAQSARSANLPESEGEPRLTSNFRRVGTGYLLELALDRPAWVYVGAGGMPRKPEPPVGSTGVVGGEDDKFHEGLSTRQVASLEACQGCHDEWRHRIVTPER